MKWVANFIDGEFYLSDPNSLEKLRLLELEIEKEKVKLAKLDQDAISSNKSFWSMQDADGSFEENRSNVSVSNTEFN